MNDPSADVTQDADLKKGAVEESAPEEREDSGTAHTRLAGQLAHRNKDDQIGNNDSDFPEPGQSPEHS